MQLSSVLLAVAAFLPAVLAVPSPVSFGTVGVPNELRFPEGKLGTTIGTSRLSCCPRPVGQGPGAFPAPSLRPCVLARAHAVPSPSPAALVAAAGGCGICIPCQPRVPKRLFTF
jgi:hypothetical protein